MLCFSVVTGMTAFLTNDVTFSNSMTDKSELLETVVSYKDVLHSYYRFATEDTSNPSRSFDDFVFSFYSSSHHLDLLEYTSQFGKENDLRREKLNLLQPDQETEETTENTASSTSSSGDANYILSSTSFSTTPSSEFKRQPYCSMYNYSSVMKGDIVWETETSFFNSGHNALIYNTSQPSSSYGPFIQTIEAVLGGVQYGFLDDLRMTEYKVVVLRVSGRTNTSADYAGYFARCQLGREYNLGIRPLHTSITSENWYCSELVYACWKYAGIDIGVKKDENGNDIFLTNSCLPSDIDNSYNTSRLSVSPYGFLHLSIVRKTWTIWTVEIRNTSSLSIPVFYNSTMCYDNDAKHWSNLANVRAIVSISPYGYQNVEISENWFATTIVASFFKGSHRIITYANSLNQNGTLSQYQSVL